MIPRGDAFGAFVIRLCGASFFGAMVGGLFDVTGVYQFSRIGAFVGILVGIPLLMWAEKKDSTKRDAYSCCSPDEIPKRIKIIVFKERAP